MVEMLNMMTEMLSRTSVIFYAGLEGMGAMEMETDGDENVRAYILFSPSFRSPMIDTGYRRSS